MNDVYRIAITGRWPWPILLEHADAITDPGCYDELARMLIADESFAYETREVVGPLLTPRLLEALLANLERTSRFLYKMHIFERSTTVRYSVLLWRLFLGFSHSKHTDADAKAWLKTEGVKQRLVELAVAYNTEQRDCRTLYRFFRRRPQWAGLYEQAKAATRI